MINGFYEVDKYPDKLPNPRLFPVGKIMAAVSGQPDTFSDGYIMDLSVRGKDRQRLEKKITRTLNSATANGLIEQAREATILLPEPHYIFGYGDVCYVFITDSRTVGMQVKYYHYFRNRYPNCSFFAGEEFGFISSVKKQDKIVGLWMETRIPQMEKEIKR